MVKSPKNVVSRKSTQSHPRNLSHLKRDRGYRWIDRDPTLDALCRIITDSNLSVHVISRMVASTFGTPVSAATVHYWLSGMTKKPQNFTMDRVAYVLGYQRSDWTRLK